MKRRGRSGKHLMKRAVCMTRCSMLCCMYHWQIKVDYIKNGCITIGYTGIDSITSQTGCMTIGGDIVIEYIRGGCMALTLQHGL